MDVESLDAENAGRPVDGNNASGDHDGLLDTLRLAMVPGVGPRMWRVLLERFGTPAAALRAAPSELRELQGVGPKLSARIAGALGEIDAEAQIALCREHDVALLTERDPRYPALLGQIPDPPAVLFVRGELRPCDGMAIAIVGTRHATSYGLRQAERLAGSLSRAGLTIVSGLARGIDAAAHRGALAAGGRTIAVLGSGVLNVYPPEHAALADEVIAAGALVSEQPPRGEPLAGTFPQRNRVISGMSLGVIVVEAGESSGALITARHAMEQGREVFAVPGRIDDRASRGCHRLIRDGVRLIESADDVLEELGPRFATTTREDGRVIQHPGELLLNEIEQQVLDAVGSEPTAIDAIVAATGLTVPNVLSTISVLEVRRIIRRLSGTTVARLS